MKLIFGILMCVGYCGATLAQGTDHIHNAPLLDTVNTQAITGSNAGMSAEPGEIGGLTLGAGRSVWFRIQLTTPATFIAKTEGSNFDTTLAVYRGAQVSEMRELASNDDALPDHSSYLTVNLQQGTYYVALDGYNGATGNYVFSYQFALGNAAAVAPENDNFVSATILPGDLAGGVVRSDTRFASTQAGEPGGGSGSVWYRYNPTKSGHVVFKTEDSAFDATLGVYTGAAVNALTAVASNDDVSLSNGNLNSEVSFNASVGTTYWIRLASSSTGGRGTALLAYGPVGMSGLPTLDHSYSGVWWDPNRSGEGFILEIADHPDPHTLGTLLNFSWYTYDTNHNAVFLFGGALIDPTQAASTPVTINLSTARGGTFGAAFNPAQVVATPWGSVTVRFLGCNQLHVQYAPAIPAWGPDGEVLLRRMVSRAPGNHCP